ncbi:MAG: iron-containing alcohol dehydrogenase [Promethearchaeota archaeon]
MVMQPKFGNWLSIDTLNSLDKYVLITMEEPWKIIKNDVDNQPDYIEYNYDMSIENLEKLYDSFEPFITDSYSIVGIGGGTSCDTAKFLVWKFKQKFGFNLNLFLIPSIISVDAFLCSSIAVRHENKVRYIGESNPKGILIDFDLIKSAPKYLNRAGVSDTISITSAIGDWKIERDEVNGKFDQNVFESARKIATDLMDAREEIRDVSEKGIEALVDGFYNEVILCEEWGNARPEEGSEHFLAYCLESITGDHYIHGNLIGMNILNSLYLQEDYAEFSMEEIKEFFDDIQITISPEAQNISYDNIRKALRQIKKYVKDEKLEYSIYNSPKLNLNDEKISEIIKLIKSY